MAGSDGNAGLIGKAEGSLQYDFGSTATSAATGGQIKNGMVWNTSGTGSIGLVKLLAYTGIGLLLWRLFRKG